MGTQVVKTFAPALLWSTVCVVMMLAVNLGLKPWQVDYTNAFVQAELPPEEEVYMSYPHGWEKPKQILKLTKYVCGLS
eukprot:15367214-Ditylum_brightwellii.AAC.2